MRKIIYLLILLPLALTIYLSNSELYRDILFGERVNILITGRMPHERDPRPDSIILLSYEPITGYLDILQIPPDTMISVPHEVTWRRVQRLDDLYKRLYRENREEKAAFHNAINAEIEKYLEDRISINYYLTYDYIILSELVERLGGIKVELEEPAFFLNTKTGYHLNFSTGTHYFGGAEAALFVQSIVSQRDERRRELLFRRLFSGLINSAASFRSFRLIPDIKETVSENTYTNLGLREFLIIIDELRNLPDINRRRQSFTGPVETRWGINYRNIDRNSRSDIIDVIVNSAELNMPRPRHEKNIVAKERISVEVWNATRRAGLAREMTEFLRRRNVDVVAYGNFGARRRMSQVISRDGDLKKAREVANIIGCRNIITAIDTSRMVDVNVVIGDDIEEIWKR